MACAPAAFVAVALLAPMTSVAQSAPSSDARAHFDAGVAASNAGRWQDALREFEQARAIQATAPVLYNLGLAQRAVGRIGDARATFRALVAEHGARLSAERRTEIQGYLTEAESTLARLELTVSPEQATVTIDGAPATARAIELDPGRHEIVVEAPGFRRQRREIELRRGGSAMVDLRLEREELRRRLIVEVDPSIASVRVDGQPRGSGTVELQLEPGTHQLEVQAPSYLRYQRSVRITDADVRLRVALERQSPQGGISPLVWVGVGVGAAAVIGSAIALGVVLGTTREDPYRGSWDTVAQALSGAVR
jgi:hypothetical protein